MHKIKLLLVAVISISTLHAQKSMKPSYLDNNQPIEKRIEDALSRSDIVTGKQIGRAHV